MCVLNSILVDPQTSHNPSGVRRIGSGNSVGLKLITVCLDALHLLVSPALRQENGTLYPTLCRAEQKV